MLDIPTFFAPYWRISDLLCRGGGARAKPHHARLNWDHHSATQIFWNPLLVVEGLIFAICDLVVSVFGSIIWFYDVFYGTVIFANCCSINRSRSFLTSPQKFAYKIGCFTYKKSSATVAISQLARATVYLDLCFSIDSLVSSYNYSRRKLVYM